MKEENIDYILIEVIQRGSTTQPEKGLLTHYNPKFASVKILHPGKNSRISYVNLNSHDVVSIKELADGFINNSFFDKSSEDQDKAKVQLNLFTVKYGRETCIEKEFNLQDAYVNVPLIYLEEEEGKVSGNIAATKPNVNHKTGVGTTTTSNTTGAITSHANTTRTTSTNTNVRRPALLLRKEPVDKNTLLSIKTLVQQIREDELKIDLPEIDGGTEIILKKHGHNRYVNGFEGYGGMY